MWNYPDHFQVFLQVFGFTASKTGIAHKKKTINFHDPIELIPNSGWQYVQQGQTHRDGYLETQKIKPAPKTLIIAKVSESVCKHD